MATEEPSAFTHTHTQFAWFTPVAPVQTCQQPAEAKDCVLQLLLCFFNTDWPSYTHICKSHLLGKNEANANLRSVRHSVKTVPLKWQSRRRMCCIASRQYNPPVSRHSVIASTYHRITASAPYPTAAHTYYVREGQYLAQHYTAYQKQSQEYKFPLRGISHIPVILSRPERHHVKGF